MQRKRPDSHHLAFGQLRALLAGSREAETYLDSTVLLLDRKQPAAPPRPLFGPRVNKALRLNDHRVDVWLGAKAAARLQAASTSGKPVLPCG